MIDPLLGELVATGSVRLVNGQIVRDGSGVLQAQVGMATLPVRWADPIVVAEGDSVLIAMSAGPTGQSTATVMCRTHTRPRPGTGVVSAAPVGSPTITVSTVEGSVVAKFDNAYTPIVGETVLLAWGALPPTVIGKVGIIPGPTGPVAPPAAPAPPPGASTTGTLALPAIDSGTWSVGDGQWNGSPHGQRVVQGSYGGRAFTGSWFYGTSATQLIGRGISAVRMYIGARHGIGSYNAPAVIHLYAHTSPGRPGSDVARVVGPHDVTLPNGWGGGWVGLPLSFASPLVSGGGISIAGSPYLGVQGRTENPQSGVVQLDWFV